MASKFKIAYVLWPRRLAHVTPEGTAFVGWVWMQRARLVNNLSNGWIAFVDEQTDEKLRTCPICKKPMESN